MKVKSLFFNDNKFNRLIFLGTIQISDEPWFARIISHAVSGREDAFCNGIRARDGKCVISGKINDLASWGWWTAFEAAHVFPLQYESLWIQNNYGRWITNMDGVTGSSKINSIQNGLLMRRDVHNQFDQYHFSINPDVSFSEVDLTILTYRKDGYKIIFFVPDSDNIDGTILDPICRDQNNPDRVSDDLLRWHFRQSILANMRGAGEPLFETDFPPGTDMMETLRSEPYGKERFEMEIATRLLNPDRRAQFDEPLYYNGTTFIHDYDLF